MRVGVNYTKRCVASHMAQEQYGSWGETWEVTFNDDFTIYPDGDEDAPVYEGEPVDFEVDDGEILHAVFAIYSSGDSFGSCSRGSTEVVAIYKDISKANHTIKRILTTDKDETTVGIVTEGGMKAKYYIPWKGYFEHLDELVIWSGPAHFSEMYRDQLDQAARARKDKRSKS